MKRPAPDLWASLLPTAGAVLALAVAYRVPFLNPGDQPGPLFLLLLIATGVAGALHRPVRGDTLGLGAVVIPVALVLSGPGPAAALAAACHLLAVLSLRLAWRATGAHDRRGLLRELESAGRTALATLAGGAVWAWLRGPRNAWPLPGALAPALLTACLLWIGLEIADRKIRNRSEPLRLQRLSPSIGLDALGWTAGGIAAAIGLAAGWTLAGLLLAVFALLVLEAARNAWLSRKARNRIHDLERLGRAGERIVTRMQEMAQVAERIRDESAKVLPFHWFQFEALAPGSELRSWLGRPEGALEEGVPEPGLHAPILPGFHRRTPWQILERQLRAEGRVIARLRFWCDPRRLTPREVDLLDLLLPQATLSVQRCLLDREANEDPLTGTALRRVLEPRLHQAYLRSCERGGPVSVVLCDLDHFKRINDTYGHPAGDAALVAVSGILKASRRDGDLCCRYGGEEFLLLLEQTGGEDALAIAERLRRKVEELPFEVEGERVPLSMSCGVACFPDLYLRAAAELILFADEALYEAKRSGRNRCLLDLGQGRYLDVEGEVHATGETQPTQEPPRIFA
jgi:diguanylate cyclase (GGDEF)-like protein